MCKRKGFTLIELLVVIAIIALLMAIIMPALNSVKKKAATTLCQSNTKNLALGYGSEARIAGEYEGKLDNGGESILLQLPESTKAAILRFTYDDSWVPETDGQGYSLVIQDPHSPASTWSSSKSWARSVDLNGSPGF